MVINPTIFRHELLVLLMVSIGANLDNLGVGIAYGMAKNPIPPFSNFLIALLSGGFTYLAMVFGSIMGLLLPAQTANEVGAIVLIAVGIWVGWEALVAWFLHKLYRRLLRSILALRVKSQLTQSKSARRRAFSSPEPNLNSQQSNLSQKLTLKETLILAFSLALNAMAGGFGASLAGHNTIAISLAVGLFSYLTIAIGQRVSMSLMSKWLGTFSQKAAGLLLMAIGAYELLAG